jgi:hypothetical protein
MAMINNQRVQQETMAKNTPKCVGNQRLPVDVPKKKTNRGRLGRPLLQNGTVCTRLLILLLEDSSHLGE